MERCRKRFYGTVFCMVAGMLAPAKAQVSIPDEYGMHIASRTLSSGDVAFGDRIDLSSGGLEIVQADVDLPGNNGLAVRVGRRFRPRDTFGARHFNRWDMDLPHAYGTFSWGGWTTGGLGGLRCSEFQAPPAVVHQGGMFEAREFWSGSFLYLPDGGEQELLARGKAHVPQDGHAYPVVTKAGAAVRCVALAPTSAPTKIGEGFEVVTPEGVIYTLNHMVSYNERSVVKSSPLPNPIHLAAATRGVRPPSGTPDMGMLLPKDYVLPRKKVILYPTQVKDRFGNVVNYVWSTTNPWHLLRIEASDGRRIDLTYHNADSPHVATVTAGTRTWRYAYALPGNTNEADTITLPDGGVWSIRLARLTYAAIATSRVTCDDFVIPSTVYSGTITSPSGATVEYQMVPTKFGRSWVPRECVTMLDDSEYVREPNIFASLALRSKTLRGPALPSVGITWSYTYGPPNHCWHPSTVRPGQPGIPCTASSPTTREVTVTDPTGEVTRHVFGNRFQSDEGLLLKTETVGADQRTVRTVEFEYTHPDTKPFSDFQGFSVRNAGDYDISSRRRPLRAVITAQDGRRFSWQVPGTCGANHSMLCFDELGRATKVEKKSE